MTRGPRLIALACRSAICMVSMRAVGASTGLVTCAGRLPRLRGEGQINVGRLALRAPRIPIALGAEASGSLEIGDRVFINEGAQVVAAISIRIGPDCRIGDFVAIHDSDYHAIEQHAPIRTAPVVIGRNVWISRGAIILPGVSIGDHSVVGAGSVVTTDVPPRTLVAGNPARAVRSLSAADGWQRN